MMQKRMATTIRSWVLHGPLLVLLLLLAGCCFHNNDFVVHAQEISTVTLVNLNTNTDIKVLESNEDIDINDYVGIDLTIRVDITGAPVDQVIFDLDDGRISRRSFSPPFYLAGMTPDGDANPVNTLKQLGSYVLVVTAVVDGTIVATFTTVLTVKDSSLDVVPTATPLSVYDVDPYDSAFDGEVNGILQKWHKITIGFSGQPTAERNNIVNPFTDFRLDVTFAHTASGKQYVVPGYYACDGNAANSQMASGPVWLVHFRPDEIGEWTYTANYWEGPNVAVDLSAGVPSDFFNGESGTFVIEETDKQIDGVDLRGKGRLQTVGKHHLQFAESGDYFLKTGTDSPENFLSYEDFDNTPNNGDRRKDWAPHINDYVEGDPTWNGGKGRGIIGAINYLSSKGMNAFSFLTLSIGGGDDGNIFPFISEETDDIDRYDCSKLAQWQVVFDHAESKGMFLHFKTQERENDQLLDNGELGDTRKLYYRELVARFGHHLALNWNLGEENTNTDAQRKAFSDYIKSVDPYNSPIVVHTWPGQQEQIYGPLIGHPTFDGVSIQSNPSNTFAETLKWVKRSATAGQPWVVAVDEQMPHDVGVAPDDIDPTHNAIRKNVLWGNIMAGGAGVEYYFGYRYPHSDLTLEDFRSRSNMWDQSRYALDFFANVPYWDMSNANELVDGTNLCLVQKQTGSPIVLYLPNGGAANVDLTQYSARLGPYSVTWFDPLSGEYIPDEGATATVETIASGATSSIGEAPRNPNQDWAVLLTATGDIEQVVVPEPEPTPAPSTTAPVTMDPSPAPTQAPVTTDITPAPSTTAPVTTPAPSTTAPVTTVSTPAPSTAAPVTTVSTPTPSTAAPAPTTTAPATTNPTQAPTKAPTLTREDISEPPSSGCKTLSASFISLLAFATALMFAADALY